MASNKAQRQQRAAAKKKRRADRQKKKAPNNTETFFSFDLVTPVTMTEPLFPSTVDTTNMDPDDFPPDPAWSYGEVVDDLVTEFPSVNPSHVRNILMHKLIRIRREGEAECGGFVPAEQDIRDGLPVGTTVDIMADYHALGYIEWDQETHTHILTGPTY